MYNMKTSMKAQNYTSHNYPHTTNTYSAGLDYYKAEHITGKTGDLSVREVWAEGSIIEREHKDREHWLSELKVLEKGNVKLPSH